MHNLRFARGLNQNRSSEFFKVAPIHPARSARPHCRPALSSPGVASLL